MSRDLQPDRSSVRLSANWRPIVLQAAGMWLATRVAFAVLARLAAREAEPAAAPAAVRALAAYPLAFFLAAPSSDALLLAAAAFTLLFARKGQWGLAALVAFVAAFTRSAAVVLFLPLVWEYGRH